MRLESKIDKAWDSLIVGDVESAYKVLVSSRLTSWHKEIIRQANFLKTYDYPELRISEDKARNEFALVASWNFLIEKHIPYDAIRWAKIENLGPLIGKVYKFTADINTIREVLRVSTIHVVPPFPQEQYYEQWPELLALSNLSLVARSLFIRIIKSAQIRLNGLVDTQTIGRLELPQTKQAFVDLFQTGFIKMNLAVNELIPDLMMAKTLKELIQFAFENSINFHGTKYQIIQSIISTIPQRTIKKWLHLKDESEFIYPRLTNLPALKDYLWVESGIFEDYLSWLRQTKSINRSGQAIIDEHKGKIINRYDPMECRRPPVYDKKNYSSDRIWKSKNMQLLSSIWDSGCDLILKNIVQRYAWDWDINIEEAVTNYFNGDKLLVLKKACNRNSFLWQFCYRRLEELNIEVRKPKLITCENCGLKFMDWSFDDRLSKRVGYKICFCETCYYSAFSDQGAENQLTDRDTMLEQISIVANILGVVPTSAFRQNLNLAMMSEVDQVALVKTLLSMPSQKKFVDIFGSWLQTLILAGVLKDGTLQTSRRVRCIAIDGHMCNSLAEKTVDDWLYSHDISHEKEPLYPHHARLNPYKMRADWKAQDILIEYAGLMDEPDYAAKMKAKQEIATEFGLSLIILQPKDILDLDTKLASLVGMDVI